MLRNVPRLEMHGPRWRSLEPWLDAETFHYVAVADLDAERELQPWRAVAVAREVLAGPQRHALRRGGDHRAQKFPRGVGAGCGENLSG